MTGRRDLRLSHAFASARRDRFGVMLYFSHELVICTSGSVDRLPPQNRLELMHLVSLAPSLLRTTKTADVLKATPAPTAPSPVRFASRDWSDSCDPDRLPGVSSSPRPLTAPHHRRLARRSRPRHLPGTTCARLQSRLRHHHLLHSIVPGVYTISADAAGTKQVLSSSKGTFAASTQYTVLIGNSAASLQQITLTDQSQAAPSGQIALRFIDQATRMPVE